MVGIVKLQNLRKGDLFRFYNGKHSYVFLGLCSEYGQYGACFYRGATWNRTYRSTRDVRVELLSRF